MSEFVKNATKLVNRMQSKGINVSLSTDNAPLGGTFLYAFLDEGNIHTGVIGILLGHYEADKLPTGDDFQLYEETLLQEFGG